MFARRHDGSQICIRAFEKWILGTLRGRPNIRLGFNQCWSQLGDGIRSLHQALPDNCIIDLLRSTLFFKLFFLLSIVDSTSACINAWPRLSKTSWHGLQHNTTIPSSFGLRKRLFFAWANPRALSPQHVPGYRSSHEVIPQARNLAFSLARSVSHAIVLLPGFMWPKYQEQYSDEYQHKYESLDESRVFPGAPDFPEIIR